MKKIALLIASIFIASTAWAGTCETNLGVAFTPTQRVTLCTKLFDSIPESLVLSETNTGVRADTSDGADNQTHFIAGGGAASAGRGSYLQLSGLEHANAGGIDLVAGTSTGVIAAYPGGTLGWTLGTTGTLIGAGTATIGWAVVDGADNTACSSQCVTPAVFGFNLAAGATAPVLVGPSDATADICLCAGAT